MSLPTRSRVSLTLASCALVATLACGGGSGGGGSSPTSPDTNTASSNTQVNTTAPVLSVAFVPTSQAAAFWVFGTKLPSGADNPTFEIETFDQTAPVYAAAAGVVINITTSSNGVDKTVFIFPAINSIYDISYDHVMNPTVSVGQTVTAGQRIGTVGILNNGRGRTELQINKSDISPVLAHCPLNWGTSAFNDAFNALAQRLNGTSACVAPTVRP